MPESFVHFHNHSSFSTLDGAAQVEQYVAKAKREGMPRIIITDHGNMSAAPDLEKYADKYEIDKAVGCELYTAKSKVSERPNKHEKSTTDEGDSGTGKKFWHLLAVAQNQTGYQNLIKLSSKSWIDGYYAKPRVDFDMLAKHSEGIIATSSCLGGIVLQAIMRGNMDEAHATIQTYIDIFSKDNFVIEIQDHDLPEQKKTNPILIELARKYGLRIIATNDSHYCDHSDANDHDNLLCIGVKKLKSDKNRFKFSGTNHYFKDAGEMRYLFRDIPEACDNTLWLSDQIEDIRVIQRGEYHLPIFEVPEGYESDDEYLAYLVEEGAKEKYGTITDAVRDRITYELGVISTMGFSSYFLVYWDLCKFMRQERIRYGFGRGSASASIIAYCTGITKVEPLQFDLPFERFLNPERKSMPDIDMDVDTRYRGYLINYLADKYGHDKVCQIITFSEIKAKSAIKDAVRILEQPYTTGEELTKAMPPDAFGVPIPLHEVLAEHPSSKFADQWAQGSEIRELYETNKAVLDAAMGVEGFVRSTGIHAGAVVVSPEPLVEYLPLATGKADEDGHRPVITQYQMGDVEDLGLVKYDLLGLRNLNVIQDAEDMIRMTEPDFNIDTVPWDDDKTYKLLQAGMTAGVFQFESSLMQELCRQIQPENMDDIATITSLGRPGPMGLGMHTKYAKYKNGEIEEYYIHPDARPILSNTKSVMTFQEQLMKVAQVFAGYSLGGADSLRKIIGKKKTEDLPKAKKQFIAGCIENGYSQSVADEWWALMEPFGSYGFSSCHAYPYGITTYQTAYLKANHGPIYMAALLTSVKDKLEKAGPILYECAKMGIEVLPPSVNRSLVDFAADGDNVRFALSGIRKMGEDRARLIVDERLGGGDYESYDDFMSRSKPDVLQKGTMQSLASAGALDDFGSRGGVIEVIEGDVSAYKVKAKKQEAGLVSIFDLFEEEAEEIAIPDVAMSDKDIRALELLYLGIALSAPPLRGWEEALEKYSDVAIADIDTSVERTVKIAGVVEKVSKKVAKSGNPYATVTVADLSGPIEMLMFSKVLEEFTPDVDQIVKVTAMVKGNGSVFVNSMSTIDPSNRKVVQSKNPVTLHLDHSELTELNIAALKDLLIDTKYAGLDAVFIVLGDSGKTVSLDSFTVNGKSALLHSNIRQVFGRDCFRR